MIAERAAAIRPDISVYWMPGCSSCLKAKEFVEGLGFEFEAVNILEDQAATDDLLSRGFRSAPVVRQGDRYAYAQNLEDVAALLGVSHAVERLPVSALMDRWEELLGYAAKIIEGFPEDALHAPAIANRDRTAVGTLMDLSAHVFDIAEAFQVIVDEQSEGKRDGLAVNASPWAPGLPNPREAAVFLPADSKATKAELVAFTGRARQRLRTWREQGGEAKIPERILMYYGEQPASQVVERYVWHSAQHARQLDHISAGRGAEIMIPARCYEGLPLPARLWE